MKCKGCGNLFGQDKLEMHSEPVYSGRFEVISSTGNAVLVKKWYMYECPKGFCGSGVETEKLELIPTDEIPVSNQI